MAPAMDPGKPEQPSASGGARSPDDLANVVKTFCAVNGPAAVEARIAWQSADLKELEARLATKKEELARQIEDLRQWIDKRNGLLAKASDEVVAIYARLKSDAAAQQLSAMPEDVAVGIISRLSPKNAGAIFDEMAPEKAARLAAVLSTPAPPPKKSDAGS
ncbi:MAG: hypothetical protein KGM42_02290 [Hyphomicrobiales bacterium]|nr:hypothetical protein [Hyphomicrobiales bacterium]